MRARTAESHSPCAVRFCHRCCFAGCYQMENWGLYHQSEPTTPAVSCQNESIETGVNSIIFLWSWPQLVINFAIYNALRYWPPAFSLSDCWRYSNKCDGNEEADVIVSSRYPSATSSFKPLSRWAVSWSSMIRIISRISNFRVSVNSGGHSPSYISTQNYVLMVNAYACCISSTYCDS